MFSLQGDGVKVTHKVPTDNVDQFEEPSRHSPSELNCQSVYNDLNDQEVLYLFILLIIQTFMAFCI